MISGSNGDSSCQRLFLRRRFDANRRAFTRADSLDRSDKPVASPRQRLDETGIGGRISQHLAKFVNACAQAVVEINEGVPGPKRVAEFLARNEFSALPEQCNQKEVGLSLELDPDASLSELAGAKIDLENAETHRANG